MVRKWLSGGGRKIHLSTELCKCCKRNKPIEEGFCEYCIVYEKDPEKGNPLPHVFEYKGEKHIIFNFKKMEEDVMYPVKGDPTHFVRKHNNKMEWWVRK